MFKLLALPPVLLGKLAVALGLRRKPDGWRRVVGVGLRNEAAKFGLSSFGLTPPSEGAVPALARFLSTEPVAHFTLRHTRTLTSRHPSEIADLVELRFAPDGTLTELLPHFDPKQPAGVDSSALVAVVSAYNATRARPE